MTYTGKTFKIIKIRWNFAVKFIDGKATDDELNDANKQLEELIKSLGMGFLVLLPFSPVTIPYLVKKAKEHKIDIIPRWYKSLRKHQDTLE